MVLVLKVKLLYFVAKQGRDFLFFILIMKKFKSFISDAAVVSVIAADAFLIIYVTLKFINF